MGNNHKNKFYFKECALSTIATGQKAENLRELYDKLAFIQPSSIYHHFWGTRLSHQYETQEYLNDFAMWCYQHIHDQTLAERLSIIDPTEYNNLEELRKELLLAIDTRLDEKEDLSWMPIADKFYFACSKIIIFDTPYFISEPEEMVKVLPKISASSIFYHFIDAHTRTLKGQDDFSAWLEGFSGKYGDLIQKLSEIDFYFSSLTELQKTIIDIFSSYGKGALR